MARADELITLTEALTLAAFGVEHDSDMFAEELQVGHYGLDRRDAHDRFLRVLVAFAGAVISGHLRPVGKFERQADPSASSPTDTEEIPSLKLHDYRAYDYTIDGLRFGEAQILWIPSDDRGYVQPDFARQDHYRDIRVARGQVRKFLGVGKSPFIASKAKPRLSEKTLSDWYAALTPAEQEMSQDNLWKKACADHPDKKVSRERIRQLTPDRPKGRPISADKKPAD